MKRHSQQQGTFQITNEFFTDQNDDYKKLNMFAEYVTNLRLNIVCLNFTAIRDIIDQCNNLNKLYIYARTEESGWASPVVFRHPRVRHLIYDGDYFCNYFDLYSLSLRSPDLETLELKRKSLIKINGLRFPAKPLEFRNLKRFTLIHDEHLFHSQMQTLLAIFKGTSTELIFLPETI